MPNPLVGNIYPQQGSPINPIRNLMGMYQNPYVLMSQMAQNNPQIAQVMKLCEGSSPKDVFYMLCQQRGVNPEDILKQLR